MTGSCDHTLMDGMVNATFLEYFESIIRDAAGVWSFDAGTMRVNLVSAIFAHSLDSWTIGF